MNTQITLEEKRKKIVSGMDDQYDKLNYKAVVWHIPQARVNIEP
jgi:hypothetical protein